MKEIKDTADTIGIEGNLARRIESATAFKELDAMIQANNRMMNRLEDLFHQQQQFTSDVAHELRTPASIIDVYKRQIYDSYYTDHHCRCLWTWMGRCRFYLCEVLRSFNMIYYRTLSYVLTKSSTRKTPIVHSLYRRN